MELRTVENHLANRDDRELNSMIDKLVEASEMVDGTLDAVRRISSGLRPSALDNLGLGTALMDEAVLFGERSGVACAIVIDTLPEALAPEVVTTTFRIFQECLTNIARHAEARRVDASLKVVENCLRLKVCDDGRGIDPRLVENPQSLGLIGMRERAENVGGKVIFRRNSVKGTEVILTIPLSSAVKPPAQTP
jgi:signal transduction histidine kinase